MYFFFPPCWKLRHNIGKDTVCVFADLVPRNIMTAFLNKLDWLNEAFVLAYCWIFLLFSVSLYGSLVKWQSWNISGSTKARRGAPADCQKSFEANEETESERNESC